MKLPSGSGQGKAKSATNGEISEFVTKDHENVGVRKGTRTRKANSKYSDYV